MKLLTIILFVVFISACDANPALNTQNTVVVKPTPAATISKEETAKRDKADSDEREKAINDFVAKNYKGWKVEGIATEYFDGQCEEDSPCDLHLINGSQNKVTTVILKQFHKTDGTSYWFVREARQIDLAKLKIEAIKRNYRDNLTTDDISDDLRDAILEAANN